MINVGAHQFTVTTRPPECYCDEDQSPNALWDVYALAILASDLLAKRDIASWDPAFKSPFVGPYDRDSAVANPEVQHRPNIDYFPLSVQKLLKKAWIHGTIDRHSFGCR